MKHARVFSFFCIVFLFTPQIQRIAQATEGFEHRALNPKQKATANEALNTIKGYHRCKAALSVCIKNKKNKLAIRLATYVRHLASFNLPTSAIVRVIEKRKASSLGPKHKIDVLGYPYLGKANAKLVIVEFADFRCGHCAKVSPLLKDLIKKHNAILFFKPYPLRPSGDSLRASQAALAAARQKKFWQMHDLLYAHPNKHDQKGIIELAKKAGLDMDRFQAAMKDRALLVAIEKSKIEGMRIGIKGTPSVYFNGRLFRLRKDIQHLEERIKEEKILSGNNAGR